MTAPLPTPADVEGMREWHVREVVAVHESGPEAWCPTCQVHWPCDAARLLALVDSVRREARAELAQVRAVCNEQDARLAAVLAMAEEVEQANGYGQRIGYTLSREQHAHDLDRIRRAATGGTP